MDRNKIRSIPEETFYRLRNLTHLRIDYNELVAIYETTFSRLVSLKVLHIENNQRAAAYLPFHVFKGLKSLEQLWVDNEQLNCGRMLASLVSLKYINGYLRSSNPVL
jgi:Leucine-rich repeat (LRR) protein